MNATLTAEDVLSAAPDEVILATGAKPLTPKFPHTQMNGVMSYATALNGATDMPEDIVIVGGGAVGCELALQLAESGHHVTVMEMLERIGTTYEAMTRKMIFAKLRDLDVQVMTQCRITDLTGDAVYYIDAKGKKSVLETPLTIFATGNASENTLYEQLKPSGVRLHRIGDCVEPRSIKEALYEGAILGRSI